MFYAKCYIHIFTINGIMLTLIFCFCDIVVTAVSKCFSKALHIRSHRVPCSCFPKKVSLQLSSEQSVGDVWIALLVWKSSTSEVKRLQEFCCRNCCVFAAPRKSVSQLTTESAKCCRTQGNSHLPSREAPV